MKVIDHIKQAKDTLISFEILPPLKGKSINSIYDHLDPLMDFKPSWVNVTYHRSETMFKKKPDGTFEKVEVRKRPGTVGICASIMNHYKIDAVPHFICGGFNKKEKVDAGGCYIMTQMFFDNQKFYDFVKACREIGI